MKHKVAELEGALLDAAVALVSGLSVASDISHGAYVYRDHRREAILFKPSKVWQDGGPIIEREQIELLRAVGPDLLVPTVADFLAHIRVAKLPERKPDLNYGWVAVMPAFKAEGEGATILIAAMRAFVASKFGAEIEFLPAHSRLGAALTPPAMPSI